MVVQEVFDSGGVKRPELLEKSRACEALGAEVVQLSVGPELSYSFLRVLEDTGYFNASLYTPFAIAGVDPLGFEIVAEMTALTGAAPDEVHARTRRESNRHVRRAGESGRRGDPDRRRQRRRVGSVHGE